MLWELKNIKMVFKLKIHEDALNIPYCMEKTKKSYLSTP